LPTLAAFAGAQLPADRAIDGQNIAPLLTTRTAPTPHERLLFFSNAEVAAVRTQDWRLVVRSFYQTFDAQLDRLNYRLLFDMKSDRGETESVWHLFPEIAARLEAMLLAARKEFAGLVQQKPLPAAGAPIQLPGETRPAPAQPTMPIFSDQPPLKGGT
jgi:arylsulfatase A